MMEPHSLNSARVARTSIAITLLCTGHALFALDNPPQNSPDNGVAAAAVQSQSEIVALGLGDNLVRPNVAIACGATDTRHQVARRKAIARIGANLNSTEIRLMLEFLDRKLVEQTEYSSIVYNAIKNEISWNLLHQTPPIESYCNALVKMYRDPQHDYIWRDYCIQHMMLYCARLKADNESNSNSAITYSVFACLHDAVKKIQSPLAGTALIGMATIAGDSAVFNDINLAEMATSIAKDPQACNETRATAIQIAADRGDPNILPLARELVSTHKDAVLRVSAIAAIGKTGGSADLETLEKLSHHRDSRISTAARHAHQKLNKMLSRGKEVHPPLHGG